MDLQQTLPWIFSVAIGLFVFDALATRTYWAKRSTLDWPWYYRVPKSDAPLAYWFYVVTLSLMGIGAVFIALKRLS